MRSTTCTLLLSVLLLVVGCGRAPEPVGSIDVGIGSEALRFLNSRLDVPATGDAVCADCHEEEWQAYQSHAMARSYYPYSEAEVVEDFAADPVWDARSGFWYRAFRADGDFFQEEFRLDTRGRRTHSLIRPMEFVMGSGNAARTYYSRIEGRLHQLPLTWFTQRSRWAMSPGYEKANKRFDRLVPDRCMACHNAYPAAVPYTDGKYEEVPTGIGCERCHGPGSVHVAARRRDSEVDGADLTIVNPAHLSPERQLDICQQCHLNTTVSLLRGGRAAYDFRPGERLDEHVALFVASDPDPDEISVISHADRLRKSACFISSERAGTTVTCTTCHDPHRTFRADGARYFDEACRRCHPAEDLLAALVDEDTRRDHLEGDACSTCHMPYVASSEAPHASFTDHRIRVVRSGQDEMPLPGTEVLEPWFDRDRSGPEAARYAGMAAITAGRQRSDSTLYFLGIDRLDAYLAEHPDDGEAAYLTGFAHLALGHVERAIPFLEQAVTQDPDVPERLNALAEAYAGTGRDPAATERLYRRALGIQPALSTIRVNLGRYLQSRGRTDEALTEYRAAAAETPWMAEAHYNIGTVLLSSGALQEGQAALDEAIALDPDYGKALANRALLALSQGDRTLGRALLERAAQAAPVDPVILGNLGAFYVEEDELDRAIPLLERAVRLDPAYFDALTNLALALIREDRSEAARAYVERALRLRPDDPLVRQLLAAL